MIRLAKENRGKPTKQIVKVLTGGGLGVVIQSRIFAGKKLKIKKN